jgi:hypothetical protein
VIGRKGFVNRTLIGDGSFGQSVPEIVFDNLLHRHIGIQPEATNVIQIRSADGIQDRQFLSYD